MTDPKGVDTTEMAADGELSDDGLDQVSGGHGGSVAERPVLTFG